MAKVKKDDYVIRKGQPDRVGEVHYVQRDGKTAYVLWSDRRASQREPTKGLRVVNDGLEKIPAVEEPSGEPPTGEGPSPRGT